MQSESKLVGASWRMCVHAWRAGENGNKNWEAAMTAGANLPGDCGTVCREASDGTSLLSVKCGEVFEGWAGFCDPAPPNLGNDCWLPFVWQLRVSQGGRRICGWIKRPFSGFLFSTSEDQRPGIFYWSFQPMFCWCRGCLSLNTTTAFYYKSKWDLFWKVMTPSWKGDCDSRARLHGGLWRAAKIPAAENGLFL